MKQISFFISILLISINHLNAQSSNEKFTEQFDRAEALFSKIYLNTDDQSTSHSKRGYSEALQIFADLYKKEPANKNLAFKIGVCYQATRKNRVQAIPYFEKAVSSVSANYSGSSYKEKSAPIITYKFLGDAYHVNYQFDKAITAYEK